MCGIFAYVTGRDTEFSAQEIQTLYRQYQHLQRRGPDAQTFRWTDRAVLGFHRLAIHDPSALGQQPFFWTEAGYNHWILINGEIFNDQDLCQAFHLDRVSQSDCEVVPLLFRQKGWENLAEILPRLNGEYAIIWVRQNTITQHCQVQFARDPCGIRPLYWQYDAATRQLGVSSLLAGLAVDQDTIRHVEPRQVYTFHTETNEMVTRTWYEFPIASIATTTATAKTSLETSLKQIHDTLTEAVRCRLASDRPIGALLSGGLDSSLVCTIAARLLAPRQKLKTFSIGMAGSQDLAFARHVAEHIGSDHTEVLFTPEQGVAAIPAVVQCLESYDITTIRASVGQYLLAQYIATNTDVKVLLNGDGSDELTLGYLYLKQAPSAEALQAENIDLLANIHRFDALRVDRCIAHFGLEARLPYLDPNLIRLYLSLPLDWRHPLWTGLDRPPQEKALLRQAFAAGNYLPTSVLFRRKEAFSDGVSGPDKVWYQVIQEAVAKADPHSSSTDLVTREATWYRQLFAEFFQCPSVLPRYWMPKWSQTQDPSATTIETY